MIRVERLMQPVTSLQGAAAVFTFTQQRIYIDLQHIDCTDAAALNAGVYVPSPGQVRGHRPGLLRL